MKTLLATLALSLSACGTEPEPLPTPSPVTTLPDCPADGVELYFVGCAVTIPVTSHVCNDAQGRQHASGCVIHDAEGTLTATCLAVCP